MKKIEKEEVRSQKTLNAQKSLLFFHQEELAYEEPDKKSYHLCIVNLVIG